MMLSSEPDTSSPALLTAVAAAEFAAGRRLFEAYLSGRATALGSDPLPGVLYLSLDLSGC